MNFQVCNDCNDKDNDADNKRKIKCHIKSCRERFNTNTSQYFPCDPALEVFCGDSVGKNDVKNCYSYHQGDKPFNTDEAGDNPLVFFGNRVQDHI